MRILFAGTPDVALPALRTLVASEHEVVGAVTRAPAAQGRSRRLVPSPVHQFAEELGIPVLTPRRIGDAISEILALRPDAAAVVAYGGLIRPPLLDAFPWLNLHVSLLPRWRGAAPAPPATAAATPTQPPSNFGSKLLVVVGVLMLAHCQAAGPPV